MHHNERQHGDSSLGMAPVCLHLLALQTLCPGGLLLGPVPRLCASLMWAGKAVLPCSCWHVTHTRPHSQKTSCSCCPLLPACAACPQAGASPPTGGCRAGVGFLCGHPGPAIQSTHNGAPDGQPLAQLGHSGGGTRRLHHVLPSGEGPLGRLVGACQAPLVCKQCMRSVHVCLMLDMVGMVHARAWKQ
jgi:hypothetical protein